MLLPISLSCAIATLAIPIAALPSVDSHSIALAESSTTPIVNTSVGSFHGTRLTLADGFTQDIFYGVPYAQPPIGSLRFARPQPVNTGASAVHNNTLPAKECYQPLDYGGVNRTLDGLSEDCLILDVYRPDLGGNSIENTLLPVWFYIHGGAFVGGGASAEVNYSSIVQTSVDRSTPVVLVAIQYRLGAFGFLGGAEVKAEALKGANGTAARNAGLHDQRQAMHWVHEHIEQFGGDPSQVTLVGESAGSISISQHLLANGGNTEGLFRAAIALSGSANTVPSLDADSSTIQEHYNDIVSRVACTSPTTNGGGNETTLECLRTVDSVTFANASNAVYNEITTSFILGMIPWIPVRDDFFTTAAPSTLLGQGKFASHIPLLSSDCLDEGTVFAPTILNTTDQFESWLNRACSVLHLPSLVTDSLISNLSKLYPSNPADGSPYRPVNSSLSDPFSSAQYKRAASLFGDAYFQAPRRATLGAFRMHAPQTPVYAYLFAQPAPGAASEYGVQHATDTALLFGDMSNGLFTDEEVRFVDVFRAQLVAFVVGLNPNGEGLPRWPLYHGAKEMLQLQVGNTTVIEDTYREDAMAYIVSQQTAFLH
ncbi:alpha/beta-hydrolase [Athelia psychrophila]|uniref:Carboxylic ester hydrolase n=1 Tax=Athelia psychrophila TaxID=1759441 RepID=A0A166AKQ6_9AGAM|nr:alpha/beta-hydrolase [Fibularhizoctonia sp. CBS 109695]